MAGTKSLLINFSVQECFDLAKHYSDVTVGAMASQITNLAIVYSAVYSGPDEKTSKLRVTGLCEGNSPVTGEFPAQRASNLEMFPFDDVIMSTGVTATQLQWHLSNINVIFNR